MSEWLKVTEQNLIDIEACLSQREKFEETFGCEAIITPRNAAILLAKNFDLSFWFDAMFASPLTTTEMRHRRESGWALAYTALGDTIRAVRKAGLYGDMNMAILKEYSTTLRADADAARTMREARDTARLFRADDAAYYGRMEAFRNLRRAVRYVYEALWSLELSGGRGEDGGDCINETMQAAYYLCAAPEPDYRRPRIEPVSPGEPWELLRSTAGRLAAIGREMAPFFYRRLSDARVKREREEEQEEAEHRNEEIEDLYGFDDEDEVDDAEEAETVAGHQ